jgi:hypothetical protein
MLFVLFVLGLMFAAILNGFYTGGECTIFLDAFAILFFQFLCAFLAPFAFCGLLAQLLPLATKFGDLVTVSGESLSEVIEV